MTPRNLTEGSGAFTLARKLGSGSLDTAPWTPTLSRKRLGALASIGGSAFAVHVAVSAALGRITPASLAAAALCFICDALLILASRTRSLSNDIFGPLGWWTLAFHAAAMATYELSLVDAVAPQFTLVTIQALVVATAVPMPPRVAVLLSTFTCATQPLGVFLAHQWGALTLAGFAWIGPTMGAALALGLSLGLYALIQTYPHPAGRTAGSFRLLNKIGSGGMGEVWAARHASLALPAAVKLIQATGDEPTAERFKREARATALLTSMHTVRLYDYGIANDGRPYYAMELLNGFDLQRVVEGTGPLPPARVVSLMEQLCDSLGEAHAAGLVHRDIKPQNVLITRVGWKPDVVKVLDFGLVSIHRRVRAAGELNTLTGPDHLAGTPAYFPPELLRESEPDARSDIYQVGCLMFYLLTGRTVFSPKRLVAALLSHATEGAPRTSDVAEQPIPEDLDRLIARCLNKSPEERPQSVSELLRELRSLECRGQWDEEAARTWWDELAVFPQANEETVARRLRSASFIH